MFEINTELEFYQNIPYCLHRNITYNDVINLTLKAATSDIRGCRCRKESGVMHFVGGFSQDF